MQQKKNNYQGKTSKDTKFSRYIVKKDMILTDFLLEVFPNKSKNSIKQLLTQRYIQIEHQVISQFDYPLTKGQEVLIASTPIPKNNDTYIDILHEDKDIIIINKPSGLLSMANLSEKENTAYHLVKLYLQKKDYKARVFIVHRLDRDTSGILVLAKNQKIKKELQDDWNDIVLKRGYVALVEGQLKQKTGTIRSYLMETKTQLVYSTTNSKDGKLAITNYQVINQTKNYSLLDISLETGRKNQIRVHMQDLHHPIIGDKKYGANTDPIRRLGLHAHQLEFIHPHSKEKIKVKTKIPNQFLQLINQ